MMAGDEVYDDDITSGPVETFKERDAMGRERWVTRPAPAEPAAEETLDDQLDW